jgi:catechol 2,3-dioxygenase-like lactoylglutathione lyase family enzyme
MQGVGLDDLMEPRITVITLGVSDLERAVTFYRDGLGLPTEGIVGTEFEHGAAAFFDLAKGIKLVLFPRRDMAQDANIAPGLPSPTEVTLGHNVRSRNEVAAVMEEARQAGAKITKAPQDRPWGGHAGYFEDPDGHLWEVVWDPNLPPEG